jgi:hypothetical protein
LNHTTGKPVKQFQLGDLPSPTYDALASKVVSMMSFFPNAGVDLNQFQVQLRYEGHHQQWKVDIESTDQLWSAIREKRNEGFEFIMITADVVDKDAPIVIKVEPSMAASAIIPTHASAIIPTHASASIPTHASASIPTYASASLPTHASASITTHASASIPTFPTHASGSKPKSKVAKKKQVSKPRARPHGSDKKISVHDKILSSMAELRALNILTPPRTQVALFSNYSNTKSMGFAKALSHLKKQGFIEYPGKGIVRLSEEGLAKAGTVDPPRSTADVHDRIKALFPAQAQKLFNSLSDGLTHPRDDVKTACGYKNEKSYGFAKSLSTLSSLGIVEYPKDPADSKKKLVRLTDISFPFGRGGNTAPTMNMNVEAAAGTDETMETESSNSDY